MGLPIWNSPPPSPRPSAAALCEVAPAGSRPTGIRRRISPRTSPREGVSAQTWSRASRGSRTSFTNWVNHARSTSSNVDTLESRTSHAVAVSLSSLNARLNDLQESAIALRNQHRQWLDSRVIENSSTGEQLSLPANDYGVPHEPEQSSHIPQDPAYETAIQRYQCRLLRARQEIQRLEAEGLTLNEQRRRLERLHTDFRNRHLSTYHDEYRLRESSEPLPQILSVPERFTSSPQPMAEIVPVGAVRAASTSSSSSQGPEMELPPLRRMGRRSIGRREISLRSPGDRSPANFRSMRAYTVEEMVDELHDGLGDRERSVESENAGENWDTMLSTIAPDDRLPSASSSFASDAASRSFSGGASNNSSRAPSAFSARTSITVPEDDGCNTEELWRSIGDRFNRGEDVPDEMWVNAGVPIHTARILSRSMRERL